MNWKRWKENKFFWIGIGAVGIVVVSGLLFLLYFSPKKESRDKDVLASAGKKVITTSDFKKRLQTLPEYYRNFAVENREVFLNDLINRELLFDEGERKGILRDKSTREKIEEAKKDIVVAQFVRKEVLGKIEVSEDELQKYYNEHKEELSSGKRSPSFEESKPYLEKVLKSQKEEEVFRNFLKELRTRSKVEINSDRLKELKIE